MDHDYLARSQSLTNSNDALVVKDVNRLATAVEQLLPRGQHRRRVWQAANALSFALFLACASLQLNDPDFFVWIPIYSLPCVLALLLAIFPHFLVSRPFLTILIGHLLICLATLVYIGYKPIATLSWQNRQSRRSRLMSNVEEANESLGLLLAIAWLCAHLMLYDLATRLSNFARSCFFSCGLICLLAVASAPVVAVLAELLKEISCD